MINNGNGIELTQQDTDIIGEVSNISMGSAATALSNIMGKKVVITSPHVEVASEESINRIEKIPSLGVIISYTEGIVGKDILIIHKDDAVEIVKALMGEMPDDDFGEIQISAIAEVMNQMMGSAATALSNFLGKTVNISPPSAFMLTEENRRDKLSDIYDSVNNIVLVRFLFKVEDVLESDLYMMLPAEFSEELVKAMMKNLGLDDDGNEQPEPEAAPMMPEPPAAQYEQPLPPIPPEQQYYGAPQMPPQMPPQPPQPQYYAAPEQQYYAVPPQMPPQYYNQPAAAQSAAQAVRTAPAQVRPVKFESFDMQPVLKPAEMSNFELIEAVPLELAVEVGKARKLVKEVLDFSVGSIIELDKQAGDPVDVIVNGQLIAHGEVVVIDESFGVRITEIINPKNKGK